MKVILYSILVIMLCGCKSITNGLAFHPNTTSTIPSNQLPAQVQEFFIQSTKKVQLQSYFIPYEQSGKLIIYFHGNAGNISHRIADLMQLNSFGINVLAISYRGYGTSTGSPSESGVYEDGHATLNYAINKLGFQQDQIFVLGRSIGTTVAIDTVQDKNIAGLILVTPLTSAADQAKAMGLNSVSSIAGKSFNNIDKIKNISCPTLVIHGTHDKVIPLQMGEAIYNQIQKQKQLVRIQGANHNDLSQKYGQQYWFSIYNFIKTH